MEGLIVVFVVLVIAESLLKKKTPQRNARVRPLRFTMDPEEQRPPAMNDAPVYRAPDAATQSAAGQDPGETSMGGFVPMQTEIREGSTADALSVGTPPAQNAGPSSKSAYGAWQRAIILREVLGPPGGRSRGYR